MKKLICFDMDNTLVYSDKAHALAYNEALMRMGFKKRSNKFLKSLFGMPHSKIVRILFPLKNKKFKSRFLEERHKVFVDRYYKEVTPIPGANKTLGKLNKLYALALLSNCSEETIKATLRTAKINKNHFRILIGSDDVKRSKPNPDEILKAEKVYHSKAEFMVGDSIYDIIAGKRANVRTIAVLTGNHGKNRLKKYHPDFILKNVNSLPNLLKKLN